MIRQVVGWRSIIGLITPASGVTTASEFAKVAPPGVVFHSITIPGPAGGLTVESVRPVLGQIEQAAKMGAKAGADLIMQLGVPICVIDGLGTDKKLIEVMEKATGVPCSTQITAVVEALRYLKATRIIIVIGYFGGGINEIMIKFMQDSGFEVLSAVDLGLDSQAASDTSPFAYYRPAKALFKKFRQAQAVFIAGGKTLTDDVIDTLERDLGVPVVTQRSATLWQAFNMLEIKDPVEGEGMLLRGQTRSIQA
jgi:maleate isomerase